MARRPGRPGAEISDETRRIILECAGFGLTHEQIAYIVGLSAKTIKKYCSEELEMGTAKMVSSVAKTLYQTAMDRNDKGHVAAAIFFLKTRGKWREKDDESQGMSSDQVKAIIADFATALGNSR